MQLYHGSSYIISTPKVKGSNITNDYGPAFYLTKNLIDAKMWACRNNESGIVNCYSINDKRYKSLKVLNLTNKKQFSVLNWLAILMHFRELKENFINKNQEVLKWLSSYYIDVTKYDVVVGYRADDAYFRFPREFIEGNLAYEDLEEVYSLGNLGVQIVFISEKAINALKFKKIINCEQKFKNAYLENTLKATNHFDAILNKPRSAKKHYALDLVRSHHVPK
ncbi:MAG: DUF3990 domain-containing protein [Bacilli bacterium]|nr:DUF3990 domain-containing protein [Bacilli bacterium]